MTYAFSLPTHATRHPKADLAHNALRAAAAKNFGWPYVHHSPLTGKAQRFRYRDHVQCTHVKDGRGTWKWEALSSEGELWLMLNTPPEAEVPQ